MSKAKKINLKDIRQPKELAAMQQALSDVGRQPNRGPTQVERILNSKAPTHRIGGRLYKGQQPGYANVNPPFMPPHYAKVTRGIPFVRVAG